MTLLGGQSQILKDITDLQDDKADKDGLFYPNNQYGGILADNINTITKSGFYTSYGTAIGVPSTSYSWFVLHINSNAGTVYAYQRAVGFDSTLRVYERVKTNSVWGSWVQRTS